MPRVESPTQTLNFTRQQEDEGETNIGVTNLGVTNHNPSIPSPLKQIKVG